MRIFSSHSLPPLAGPIHTTTTKITKATKQQSEAAAAAAAPLLQRVLSCFAVLIICGRRAEAKTGEREQAEKESEERRQSRHPACHDTPTSTSIQWELWADELSFRYRGRNPKKQNSFLIAVVSLALFRNAKFRSILRGSYVQWWLDNWGIRKVLEGNKKIAECPAVNTVNFSQSESPSFTL